MKRRQPKPPENKDEDVQSIRGLQKWAKGMGAPPNILRDLRKLEENKENLRKVFSGQNREVLAHIMKHVKPRNEAEHIKKTVALYKLKCAAETVTSSIATTTSSTATTTSSTATTTSSTATTTSNTSDVQGKPLNNVANYLLLKEKQEKIQKLKEQCKCEERKIKWYKTRIDEKISEYKEISQDTHDMLKTSVILELKNKAYKKQIDQWNEEKEKLKLMNIRNTEQQADRKEAKKKVRNDVKLLISKMVEMLKTEKSQEEIASVSDQFIKDISELSFSTLPNVIVAELAKIVKDCCKVIIDMKGPNPNVENVSECRKGIDKYLTELYQLQAEKNEETKTLKSMVKKEEEIIQTLKGELMEILDKKYFLRAAIGSETPNIRDDISDCVNLHIEKRILSETNVLIHENIDTFSREIDMRNSVDPENLVHKFHLIRTLRNSLTTQTKRVKYCMDDKYKTSVAFCRQLNYISLNEIDFEFVSDIMRKEVEMIMQSSNKISKSSWERGPGCLQSLVKQKLSENFQGPDHMVIRNTVESIFMIRKLIEFQYNRNVCGSTVPLNTDYQIEDIRKQKSIDTERFFTQLLQNMDQKVSESRKLIENIGLIIETWSAQHFNDWIPESLELNGKPFLEWKDSE